VEAVWSSIFGLKLTLMEVPNVGSGFGLVQSVVTVFLTQVILAKNKFGKPIDLPGYFGMNKTLENYTFAINATIPVA
jgi:hypothetical protein